LTTTGLLAEHTTPFLAVNFKEATVPLKPGRGMEGKVDSMIRGCKNKGQGGVGEKRWEGRREGREWQRATRVRLSQNEEKRDGKVASRHVPLGFTPSLGALGME